MSDASVAVFDFDNTLIKGDSLWPFLVYVAGTPRTLAALAQALALLIARRARNKSDPVLDDPRTFIKAHLLQRLLSGQKTAGLAPAVEKLRGWQKWNEPVRRALFEHHAQGRRIVVASGGLDLYLPELLKDLPAHDLICTQADVKDGVVTDAMISGNCVRVRKADMLAVWLARNGPFPESWGYGNFPHDVPMLALLRHRIIVS